MKYIFDLDETLIQSTTLNNDSYNYAMEKFGYPRINTSERLTREKLKFLPSKLLRNVIQEKQKYFTSEWLPYRILLNTMLIERAVKYSKENCYLWTRASESRVESILRYCNLEKLFYKVIFDDKLKFQDSILKLKAITQSREFIIYENNKRFFDNERVEIIEQLSTENFDVTGYLINT